MSAKNAPAAPAPFAFALDILRAQVKGRGYGSNRLVYDQTVEAAFEAAKIPLIFPDTGKESDALDKAAIAFLKALSTSERAPGAVMIEVIRRAALEGMNVDADRGAVKSIQGKAALSKAACGAGKPEKTAKK